MRCELGGVENPRNEPEPAGNRSLRAPAAVLRVAIATQNVYDNVIPTPLNT